VSAGRLKLVRAVLAPTSRLPKFVPPRVVSTGRLKLARAGLFVTDMSPPIVVSAGRLKVVRVVL
jgi:hypothetical protein